MKFETLNTEPGVTFGTTVAGRTFYYSHDDDDISELVNCTSHRRITDPSYVREIKKAMEEYYEAN